MGRKGDKEKETSMKIAFIQWTFIQCLQCARQDQMLNSSCLQVPQMHGRRKLQNSCQKQPKWELAGDRLKDHHNQTGDCAWLTASMDPASTVTGWDLSLAVPRSLGVEVKCRCLNGSRVRILWGECSRKARGKESVGERIREWGVGKTGRYLDIFEEETASKMLIDLDPTEHSKCWRPQGT